MDPSNPYVLFFHLLLSTIAGSLCWRGFRARRPSTCLYGIGALIPAFGVDEWRAWMFGIAVCGAGWWVQRNLDV